MHRICLKNGYINPLAYSPVISIFCFVCTWTRIETRNERAKNIELHGNMGFFFFECLSMCSYFYLNLNLLLYTFKIVMSQSIKPSLASCILGF